MPDQSIKKIIVSLCRVIDDIEKIALLWDKSLARHRDRCLAIPDLIEAGKIRIAVVGAIKSGKSTFINSMFKKELLQRGAGVKTSINTVISKGQKNMACLTFASWDEINQCIKKSLLSFPEEVMCASPGIETDSFDIRREKDRHFLARVQEAINCQYPTIKKEISSEAMLISYALGGYEFCKDFVKADPASVLFESKNITRHTKFTSDPNNAFYVSKAKIQVHAPSMPNYIEISDCQGTDSIDPAQLEKIIGHIESTNLMIYCISSRQGLRRADMEFLSIIRDWGLMTNMVFCINCDISEHPDIKDLQCIIEKVSRDLQYFVPNPSVFTFSFLYDLFEHLGSNLSSKEKSRFDLWKKENEITEFCTINSLEFNKFLNILIEQKRSKLLVSNHIHRINLIIGAIRKRTDDALELLIGDKKTQESIFQEFSGKKEQRRYLSSIAEASVDRTVSELKKNFKRELQNFFIKDPDSIYRKMASVINHTDLLALCGEDDSYESFRRISYKMFQRLRHRVDKHMAKQFLPQIRVFVQEREQALYKWRDMVMESFINISQEENPENNIPTNLQIGDENNQISSMETILGIKFPWPVFRCAYNKKIQIRAVGGMGIEGILDFCARIIGRDKKRSVNSWFKRAEKEIKYQCLKEIRQQMEKYLENLWVNYYSPIISGFSRNVAKKIHEHFEEYESVSQNLEKIMLLEEKKKKEQRQKIIELQQELEAISNSLAEVQDAIHY